MEHLQHNREAKVSMEKVKHVAATVEKLKEEISKVFFGQEKVVESLIRSILCDGHVLIEGIPGIAKTLVIKAIAKASGCSYKRIQFTVDLLPTDIVGLTSYEPHKGFEIVKGPIFANFIIADEINRSPPKTQSALIEAMQEKQVSIGKQTFKLPSPFFVMANENPIENEGVYTLPEAQVDRFIFKVIFGYPEPKFEEMVMQDNVTFRSFEDFKIKPILSPQKILELQKITKEIYLDQKIRKYILDIVAKTRSKDFAHGEYIELGGSPRATIAIYIASKAEALMKGRNYVLPQDVKNVAHDCLRHRLILSYRARADKIDADLIINEVLKAVSSP